jgi:hypothetical protein
MPHLRCASAFLPYAALNAILAGALGSDDINPKQAEADSNGKILWYDLRLLDLEGKGWTDTKAPYDRLPARAEGVVRCPVWDLSRHSAGLCVRFVSDASSIHARWTLTSGNLAMPHMPATGVSGLDLYVRSDKGRWQWLGVGQPSSKSTTAQLVTYPRAGLRQFRVFARLLQNHQAPNLRPTRYARPE